MNCPICLELFTEDEAYIPPLVCGCNLIVHIECWQQWSGECLYCRNTHVLEEPVVLIHVNPPVYNLLDRMFLAILIFLISVSIQAVILRSYS